MRRTARSALRNFLDDASLRTLLPGLTRSSYTLVSMSRKCQGFQSQFCLSTRWMSMICKVVFQDRVVQLVVFNIYRAKHPQNMRSSAFSTYNEHCLRLWIQKRRLERFSCAEKFFDLLLLSPHLHVTVLCSVHTERNSFRMCIFWPSLLSQILSR